MHTASLMNDQESQSSMPLLHEQREVTNPAHKLSPFVIQIFAFPVTPRITELAAFRFPLPHHKLLGDQYWASLTILTVPGLDWVRQSEQQLRKLTDTDSPSCTILRFLGLH